MTGQEFTQLRAEQAQRFIDDEPLFEPVDFTVTPGSCVVLRGPNGSGKSTMLRLATGQLMVSSGRVLLDEVEVDERDPRLRSVMAVLMDPVIGYRDLTTQDHLVLIDQTWGLPRDTCADRVNAMLSRWGIEHLRHRFRHEMSSGQRQLVDLAMTLMRPSSLLVLDEPEQRLDVERRVELAQMLLQLKKSGAGLLLACHDDQLTDTVADTVVTIHPPAA